MTTAVLNEYVSANPSMANGLADVQRVKLRQLAEDINASTHYRAQPGSSGIRIVPAQNSGFPLTLHVDRQGCVLFIGGLIQEFDDLEVASVWIRRIITNRCRLKVEVRGRKQHSWTLQSQKDDGEWCDLLHSDLWSFLPSCLFNWKTEYHYHIDTSAA